MTVSKRRGEHTVLFETPPRVLSTASIVGDMEGAGPLGHAFDMVLTDDTWGESSWEKAECKMFEQVVRLALTKVNWDTKMLHCLLGGDLLNQIITANYAARQLGVPFLGLYGACSTMAESLLLGSMLVDGGFAHNVACVASSHFSTAERQYRYPLEMGTTSPPTAQRTVTGSGAVLLSAEPAPAQQQGPAVFRNIHIESGTIGKVVDMGISDASNMGAAMAPAACDTIVTHLSDTGRAPSYYDAIITGDLGSFGSEMLQELCMDEGVDIKGRHLDCGNLIFDSSQNVNCGGSGCGCSAVVLSAHLLQLLEKDAWKRILFMATGALMSPSATQQGETIPGIAHAVVLERDA